MPVVKDIQKVIDIWRHEGFRRVSKKILHRLSMDSYWTWYSGEAMVFASWMDFSSEHIRESQKIQEACPGELDFHSITWFFPEFINPYYGGIYTLLRFADYYKREKGIDHRFMVLGSAKAEELAEMVAQSFPSLAGEPIQSFNLYQHVNKFEPTDIGVATLWATAYHLLRFNQTKRKFYFMQDYEPLFYPAGSVSAQIEATYSFGFYGIANTPTIKDIYERQYGGKAEYFLPCVDPAIFYPGDQQTAPDPFTIFFYSRPGHPRNGFELGAQALRLLKKRLGKSVRIVAAGDLWNPRDYGLKGVVENLGRLEYQQTAELYRKCHAGLIMMFTRHPSYLPFELMACGSLVVTNYNPATSWLLRDNDNCILSRSSASCLAEVLEKAYTDQLARVRITTNAARLIQSSYSDWKREMEKIYWYMHNPYHDCPTIPPADPLKEQD